jgi:hypothetical protein
MLCLDQCGAKDLLTTLCLIKRQAKQLSTALCGDQAWCKTTLIMFGNLHGVKWTAPADTLPLLPYGSYWLIMVAWKPK